MARKGCRAAATAEQVLTTLRTQCAGCGLQLLGFFIIFTCMILMRFGV